MAGDLDIGVMDGAKKEFIPDDWFYYICAICEEGGALLCCEGPCMRAFHACVMDGRHAHCDSLGFTKAEAIKIKNFYCKNCIYNQHQCFACGKLGSSGNGNDAEVYKCASETCNHFYHPQCVAKLLPKPDGDGLETNVADAKSFTCPVHVCLVCKGVEDPKERELNFAVCGRCPKTYHRKCLPKEITLVDTYIGTDMPRGYDLLLPRNRILMYCMNHEMDRRFWSPPRDHIKFPLDCGEDVSSSHGGELSDSRV